MKIKYRITKEGGCVRVNEKFGCLDISLADSLDMPKSMQYVADTGVSIGLPKGMQLLVSVPNNTPLRRGFNVANGLARYVDGKDLTVPIIALRRVKEDVDKENPENNLAFSATVIPLPHSSRKLMARWMMDNKLEVEEEKDGE